MSGGCIEGRGTPETAWLASPLVREMPRTTYDALVASARRLVVVAPHPDDEVLGCGGLIALAARNGLDVVVVAVTDGEGCYPDNAAWSSATLATTRRAELAVALGTLGLPASVIVHAAIPDGAVASNIGRLRARLADIVQGDDLMLVTWARDGHPDHEASAVAAVAAAGDRGVRVLQYPVWGWHWAHPDNADLTNTAPLRLDLDDNLQVAKARAIDCFASQLGRGPAAVHAPILPPHVVQRFVRPFEVFLA